MTKQIALDGDRSRSGAHPSGNRRPVAPPLSNPSEAADRPLKGMGRWFWFSIIAAVLGMGGNAVGLVASSSVYGRETVSFVNQAIAQDAVNLVIVAPALMIATIMAARGSLRALAVWFGLLAFTIYNYVIYTMGIHVGPLYLLWIAVLGLASYALIGAASRISRMSRISADTIRAAAGNPPTRFAAWFQIIVAGLFGLLWLRDIVGAMIAGRVPSGAAQLGLPSNPVHVLDLALFLPALTVSGILLLRRHPLAYLTTPAAFVFAAATGLPALATPVMAAARGVAAEWGATAPMAVLTIIAILTLSQFVWPARRPSDHNTPASAR